MSQHSSLSPERWQSFTAAQQILMIANEMNRAAKLMRPEDDSRRLNSYARVLQLADLTVDAPHRSAFRGELLRWRDLVAKLYFERVANPVEHDRAMDALLLFTGESAKQRGHVARAVDAAR